MKKVFILLVMAVLGRWLPVAAQKSPITVNKASATAHGPENGSLLIIGGNVGFQKDIWDKFTELAGGKENGFVVVVTTASGDSAAYDQKDVDEVKKQTGIKKVVLLHTNDLKEANSEAFITPLKKATAVYFVGGRQWRIADSYLNTLTHLAFFDVLKRGGVIAGSSAGATIIGSFLWRGDTKGAQIEIGDHTQGLGFLKNAAIDQHVLARNRQFALVDFIKKAPQLIGIGLNEATAILVQKDTVTVLGKSYVAIYDFNNIISSQKHVVNGKEDFTASDGPFFFLSAGQKYDLYKREVIKPLRKPGVNENKTTDD